MSCLNTSAINDALLQALRKEVTASSFMLGIQQTLLPKWGISAVTSVVKAWLSAAAPCRRSSQPVRSLRGTHATFKRTLNANIRSSVP